MASMKLLASESQKIAKQDLYLVRIHNLPTWLSPQLQVSPVRGNRERLYV